MTYEITAVPASASKRCLVSFHKGVGLYGFNYGAALTARVFQEIYVSRPPRSQNEEHWLTQVLHTRLTPNGKIIHG